MKKYTFEGILLALGLVLTTLNIQAGGVSNDRAWQTQLALTNAASTAAVQALDNATLVMNADVDFPAKTTAVEASKQANVAFDVEIQALDAVKRLFADEAVITTFKKRYMWVHARTSGLGETLAKAIEAKRVADLAAPWLAQLALTKAALTAANEAMNNARVKIETDAELSTQRAAIRASKQANAALKVEIQALDAVKRDQDDEHTITEFNQSYQILLTQTRSLERKLPGGPEDLTWTELLAITNTALTTASNAVIEARRVLASTVDFPAKRAAIEASKQANAAFKVEIQALDAVKRDQDDGVIVTTFNDQHQVLKTQITELEVALAAAIEAKRVADLATQWQAQLALTNTALTTANTAVANATSVMNSDAELSSKTTAVEGSKQANAAFKVEIQALKLVERDATDEAVTTAFNDHYQTLLTQTTALEARLAAPDSLTWAEQLAIANTAHSAAANAVAQATTVMNSDADLTDKLTAIDAAKQANIAFNAEIQVLDSVKRGDQDIPSVNSMNAQLLRLVGETDALVSLYNAAVAAKRSAEERQAFLDATLVGHWKNPVIKGLDFKTSTRQNGYTNSVGEFRCQPGELVTFSIGDLILTTTTCDEISDTKTTKNVSLSVTTEANFKDWQGEEGKQLIITKVLFGLFGDKIKNAFAENEKYLRIVDARLTDEQKINTANQSLDANDLSLLVQEILGTTEAVVLPTTEQATNMVNSGWQKKQVFESDDDTIVTPQDTGSSSTGGGCVYNSNATGRADVGFILLMVLSVYYLVRRKRLIT